MRRRTLLKFFSSTLAGFPFSAWPQQSTRPLIGLMMSAADPAFLVNRLALVKEVFKDQGLIDGVNVEIHSAIEGTLEEQAKTFVARKATVILTFGNQATKAAKAATNTIPIVFVIGGDPVELGLTKSLNKPDVNLTGVSLLNNALEVKRLEIFSEIVTAQHPIGVIINRNGATTQSKIMNINTSASQLGREVRIYQFVSETDIYDAITTAKSEHFAGMLVTADDLLNSLSSRLGKHFDAMNIPAIAAYREFMTAGGLASYSPNLVAGYRLHLQYAVRILKGEKPSEMPIEQQSQFELGLNLKAARSLGITLPLPLVARADEVIE